MVNGMFFKLIKGNKYTDTINIETAKTIGQWIKDQYPNVTLYIIGSVLNADLIHRGSDIDFVIYRINDTTHELRNLETLADELKTVKDFDSCIQEYLWI